MQAQYQEEKLRTIGTHLNLDDAWDSGILGLHEYDLRNWGPILRYTAPQTLVESFYCEIQSGISPFTLYGSGDFHYLTALFIRQIPEPITIVSFDNHPDWDRRPPRWSCGSWTSRALADGKVEQINIWGCGNFELRFPHLLFADRAAVNAGRLIPYAWAERQDLATQRRFNCITRQDWKGRFADFAKLLFGKNIYITVDLDCLQSEEAVTNWENGLFTTADLVWALSLLNEHTRVIGGDICGAYSLPRYARWTQRIAGNWDHPKIDYPDESTIRKINQTSVELIWPVLLSGSNA